MAAARGRKPSRREEAHELLDAIFDVLEERGALQADGTSIDEPHVAKTSVERRGQRAVQALRALKLDDRIIENASFRAYARSCFGLPQDERITKWTIPAMAAGLLLRMLAPAFDDYVTDQCGAIIGVGASADPVDEICQRPTEARRLLRNLILQFCESIITTTLAHHIADALGALEYGEALPIITPAKTTLKTHHFSRRVLQWRALQCIDVLVSLGWQEKAAVSLVSEKYERSPSAIRNWRGQVQKLTEFGYAPPSARSNEQWEPDEIASITASTKHEIERSGRAFRRLADEGEF